MLHSFLLARFSLFLLFSFFDFFIIRHFYLSFKSPFFHIYILEIVIFFMLVRNFSLGQVISFSGIFIFFHSIYLLNISFNLFFDLYFCFQFFSFHSLDILIFLDSPTSRRVFNGEFLSPLAFFHSSSTSFSLSCYLLVSFHIFR